VSPAAGREANELKRLAGVLPAGPAGLPERLALGFTRSEFVSAGQSAPTAPSVLSEKGSCGKLFRSFAVGWNMNIHLIAVGKIKEPFYKEGAAHYQERLRPYARLKTTELAEAKEEGGGEAAIRKALEEEAQAISRQLRDEAHLLALSSEGLKMTSIGLASYLDGLLNAGKGKLDIVIGGPLGLAPDIKKRADLLLSLSELTFPHRLARIIILEQLYRSFKILRGEPYHR